MTREDLTSPVAAAATSQVKLCPYNEEELHIWFSLIEAQFAMAGIKSQKLKYANTLASLPKQVLRDILDTLDVCNNSDEPFNFLKNTLLRQFGKSKWQSYFELLRLPMEMQGLKPSVLMGKLKQHLPPGVSPDNDLFLAMFLIHLPPSMRETVGAGAHKTAAAMVKAADTLWDAWGGPRPYGHSCLDTAKRIPAPSSGKRINKRGDNVRPKSRPLPTQIFILFRTLAMACVNFTTTTSIGLTGAFHPVLGQKTNSPPDPFQFGGFFHTCHYHGYAFSRKHWLDFLTDKLTNDRYLVDTGAPLSIVPCNQNSSPSGPLLKEADGQPIPSWGFIQKTAISRQNFYINFSASRCGRPHSGHRLFKEIQSHCFSRNQPAFFSPTC